MATRSPSGPANTPGSRVVTWRSCFNLWVGVKPARLSFARLAWPPVGPTAASSIKATATSTTMRHRRRDPVVHQFPGGVGLRRTAVDQRGNINDRMGGAVPSGVVVEARSSVGGLVVSTVPYGASETNKRHAGRLRITLRRAPCSSGRIPILTCGSTSVRSTPVSRGVPSPSPETVHAVRSPWFAPGWRVRLPSRHAVGTVATTATWLRPRHVLKPKIGNDSRLQTHVSRMGIVLGEEVDDRPALTSKHASSTCRPTRRVYWCTLRRSNQLANSRVSSSGW